MLIITKEIQFDYGHIVHLHNSKCKNPHGHRARVEAEVIGNLVTAEVSEQGMVADFKYIKEILMNEIHDVLDHSFIISKEAPQLPYFESMNTLRVYSEEKMKLVVVDFVPTAENLAKWCYDNVAPKIEDKYGTGLRLLSIKFWETPTSCARYTK